MLILIKGAGDLASGVALRLRHCHFQVVMTDLSQPTAIRRTVAFSPAITEGWATVEDVTGRHAADPQEALAIAASGDIAVLADPEAACRTVLKPDILIDAILAKHNINTAITDAPLVLALGPGFTAGADCHCVIETMRGHTLGRPICHGGALPNTGSPGSIGGFTTERVLRAPCAGKFIPLSKIGDTITTGQAVASVEDSQGKLWPVTAQISGILRGILPEGIPVQSGMKSGDIDPRCELSHCYTVSDKALAIGGGVLEAILHLNPSLILNSSILRTEGGK